MAGMQTLRLPAAALVIAVGVSACGGGGNGGLPSPPG